MTQLPVYQSKRLQSYPAVKHGFFTRLGGVSLGSYSSLNMALSKTDPQKNVIENQRLVGDWFGIDRESVLTALQEHTSHVVVVTEPYSKGMQPQADALITALPNIAIGILTADCAPILMYAPQAHLIAAIHAGWKGAKAGIITHTLEKLESLGTQRENIIAAIGPAISQDSYEVDDLFYNEFLKEDLNNLSFFKSASRASHYLFDLPGYVIAKLKTEGIQEIEHVKLDTYQNEQLFFSCRRACHRQESVFGNQISAIMLA